MGRSKACQRGYIRRWHTGKPILKVFEVFGI